MHKLRIGHSSILVLVKSVHQGRNLILSGEESVVGEESGELVLGDQVGVGRIHCSEGISHIEKRSSLEALSDLLSIGLNVDVESEELHEIISGESSENLSSGE